ncbi:DUF2207 domain-containing protein [Actinacidiphila soli]|uniref:DUF2207 domain-containing protein n=1 Tax=Actinacidiphila soli TaxID=2487275 RepID=UPI0013E3F4EC|nr:DUF2207 domain-containing protein [Actinacidiphila soli]
MFFAVLLLGGVVGLAGVLGNTERVNRMWVSAVVAKDGSARITEVIDYDFGHPDASKHGIYRDIPGLTYDDPDNEVRATVDGAPVPYELTYGETTDRSIRVGDPDNTVSGLHRYRIQYTLQNVVRDGKLAWDGVGTGWKTDLDNVEIHVVAPYDLTGTRCVQGKTGSQQSCKVAEPESGHLVVTLDKLKAGRGTTLYASGAASGAADRVAAPVPPSGAADGDAIVNPLWTLLLVAGLALGSGLLTVWLLRLVGRDRLVTDGPSGSPLGTGGGGGERRVDIDRLMASLTPTSAPPDGLSPAQGGILLVERVEPQHQVAWLLGTAIDGYVTIEGAERYPTVRRNAERVPTDPDTEAVLDEMFAGREEFTLGLRDQRFRTAWQILGTRMTEWQLTSGLWDPAGEQRDRTGQLIGIAATLLGFVAAIVGSVLNGSMNPAGWPTTVLGALAAGTGLALSLRSWELQSRTACGTALWLQVESFRRYLADPSPQLADGTTDDDQLELYTAWAVALGEASGWQQAVTASTAAPAATGTVRRSTALVRYGPALAVGLIAAAAVSGTPPSSSGSSGSSGGGSDGGVGGGEGGGGGGSW